MPLHKSGEGFRVEDDPKHPGERKIGEDIGEEEKDEVQRDAVGKRLHLDVFWVRLG